MFHPNGSVPDSPSSFHDATTTIDKLTLALSNYSRVPSPEPVNSSTCCCGREECECTKAWTAYKAKLETRLVLSAGEYSCSRGSYHMFCSDLQNTWNCIPNSSSVVGALSSVWTIRCRLERSVHSLRSSPHSPSILLTISCLHRDRTSPLRETRVIRPPT